MTTRIDGSATSGDDFIEKYGLKDVMKELYSRMLRKNFMKYTWERSLEKVSVKPRLFGWYDG